MERADVGDADGGAGHGEDQRVEPVERLAAGQARAGEDPGDRHADDDAQQDGEARIEEAVHDVLRRLDDHALEEEPRVAHRERRHRPALAHRGERDAEIRDERERQDGGQERHGRRPSQRAQPPPGQARVGQRGVVLDRDVAPRRHQEDDGQRHHERGDHQPHAEQPAVDELHDVEVGLRGQQVVDAQHQRRREVRKRPDEDEQRTRHVARRRERQRDRGELAPAARADGFGRLLQRGIDLAQRVDHVERDHREEVQRLHQQHAVHAVDEVDRLGQPEPVLQHDVDGARLAHDEGEAQHADERRRDDRDQREVAEEAAPGKVVAHQQQRDREAEHGGGGHGAGAEQQRVPERSPVEGVGSERREVLEGQPSRLVAERVVEHAQQRVDEEDRQERPDQRDAEGRQRRFPLHSSRSTSVTDAGNATRTGRPAGSTSWCHGSPTSTLSTRPVAVSMS